MTEVMVQQASRLAATTERQDVVSKLLDDYTYEDTYGAEDVLSKFALAPTFKELPPPPPRADSLKDPKDQAIQRMNTKFQLREDDEESISSNGSCNGSVEQTPRTRITSRSLSRSGTPPSLKLYVSNGATAHIPPKPVVCAPIKPVPSSIVPETKELPPPPPERSIKRKAVQAATMGHRHSKSELERNDSFHSQNEGRTSERESTETAGALSPVKRKPVPGAGVKNFVSLLELNNGPRGAKPAPAPTSAPQEAAPSILLVKKDLAVSTGSQLPPTPPEEKSVPSPPRKALVGVGPPSNPRPNAPMSPLHTRGKSNTGFNILKAQRPAPPIPTLKKEVVTPEQTPSPTLKPEVRVDVISPMKPLPPPFEQRRPFSYDGPIEQEHGERKEQVNEHKRSEDEQQESKQHTTTTTAESVTSASSQTTLPPRTTSLDPPEPNPSIHPSTAPAPQPTFTTTHPSIHPPLIDTTPNSATQASTPPFIPLTKQPIPLPTTLIPHITPSQLHCYTSHHISVWSNNTFHPMGCMICHSNTSDRKMSCTFCQLRICCACSEELRMVPGRDLGRLLEAKNGGKKVDEVGEGVERGRAMERGDSSERRTRE